MSEYDLGASFNQPRASVFLSVVWGLSQKLSHRAVVKATPADACEVPGMVPGTQCVLDYRHAATTAVCSEALVHDFLELLSCCGLLGSLEASCELWLSEEAGKLQVRCWEPAERASARKAEAGP